MQTETENTGRTQKTEEAVPPLAAQRCQDRRTLWDSAALPDWFSSNLKKDAHAGGNPPSARWRVFPGTLPALQTPTDGPDGRSWPMLPAPILLFCFGYNYPARISCGVSFGSLGVVTHTRLVSSTIRRAAPLRTWTCPRMRTPVFPAARL